MHTPGPWKAAELFRDQRIVRPENGGYPLAVAYPQRDKFGKPHYDADANAHLIAAAPELLELATRAYALLDSIYGTGAEGHEEWISRVRSDLDDLLSSLLINPDNPGG